MIRPFALGAAAGAAVTLVATLGLVLLRPNPPPGAPRPSARLRDAEPQIEALRRELTTVRAELRTERARAAQLQLRLEQLAPQTVPPPSDRRPSDLASR